MLVKRVFETRGIFCFERGLQAGFRAAQEDRTVRNVAPALLWLKIIDFAARRHVGRFAAMLLSEVLPDGVRRDMLKLKQPVAKSKICSQSGEGPLASCCYSLGYSLLAWYTAPLRKCVFSSRARTSSGDKPSFTAVQL